MTIPTEDELAQLLVERCGWPPGTDRSTPWTIAPPAARAAAILTIESIARAQAPEAMLDAVRTIGDLHRWLVVRGAR